MRPKCIATPRIQPDEIELNAVWREVPAMARITQLRTSYAESYDENDVVKAFQLGEDKGHEEGYQQGYEAAQREHQAKEARAVEHCREHMDRHNFRERDRGFVSDEELQVFCRLANKIKLVLESVGRKTDLGDIMPSVADLIQFRITEMSKPKSSTK